MLMCVMERWVNVCERMRDRHRGRRLHNEIAFLSNISQDGLLLIYMYMTTDAVVKYDISSASPFPYWKDFDVRILNATVMIST